MGLLEDLQAEAKKRKSQSAWQGVNQLNADPNAKAVDAEKGVGSNSQSTPNQSGAEEVQKNYREWSRYPTK